MTLRAGATLRQLTAQAMAVGVHGAPSQSGQPWHGWAVPMCPALAAGAEAKAAAGRPDAQKAARQPSTAARTRKRLIQFIMHLASAPANPKIDTLPKAAFVMVLRMYGVQDAPQAGARRLLRVLLLWINPVSADSRWEE